MAIVAVMIAFGSYAYSKMSVKRAVNSGWFEVTYLGAGTETDPANLEIGEMLNTPPLTPEQEGECRIENQSTPCAVHLYFGEGVDPEDLDGLNLQAAIDSVLLEVDIRDTDSPDGYAKQWKEPEN